MLPDRDQLIEAANRANREGRLDESEQLLRQVLGVAPDDMEAKLFLGMVAGKAGKNEEAEDLLRQALEVYPGSFEVVFWLSILCRRRGESIEAVTFARRAAAIQPTSPHALNNLGFCEMEAGNLDHAATAFASSSRWKPDNATVLYNWGTCLQLLGRDVDAVKAFRRATALAPGSADSWVGLARSLFGLDDSAGALTAGNQAFKVNPGSGPAHALLGLILMHQGRSEDAQKHLARALEIDPSDGLAYAVLGSTLQASGAMEGANRAFRKSIELQPKQAYAYFALVHNLKVVEQDRALVSQMEALIEDGHLSPRDIANLHYGLGKAYENLGEYGVAMDHYDQANQLARSLRFGDRQYDSKRAAMAADQTIRLNNRAFFDRASSEGLKTDFPIFIVGMMRSGTTLVEQILSSHPRVEAGGEQEFWVRRGPEALAGGSGIADLGRLKTLALEYLTALEQLGPTAGHVTDKMPANYHSLGLIHAAFPNARIIHSRRNPADTAISIYTTPNRFAIEFAHDKRSIVAAYKEYLRLMAHWRAILPADRLLEVDYEDLVHDRDVVTHKLAEFCGLDWNEAMLRPEENERQVVTPSVWQVRQPVYTTSVDRWKRYEPWLGSFRELLELEVRS